jgi:hypothetical protein
MSFPRKLYEGMMQASMHYARWDYEVSMNILRSKKRMLVLIAMAALVPGFSLYIADAADLLGGKKAYAPSFTLLSCFLFRLRSVFVPALLRDVLARAAASSSPRR